MLSGHYRICAVARIRQPISLKLCADYLCWHDCCSTRMSMSWVIRAGQSAICQTVRTIKSRLLSMLVCVDVSLNCWCKCAVNSLSTKAATNFTCAISRRHESHNIVKAALRAVGNIVTGDDIQTQVILNSGALPHILHLLSSEKESIRKEASWTISNITAGNRQQIQAVIDANIFPVLIHILKNDEFKTRKEAAWSITNATSSGTAEQIKYLVFFKFT